MEHKQPIELVLASRSLFLSVFETRHTSLFLLRVVPGNVFTEHTTTMEQWQGGRQTERLSESFDGQREDTFDRTVRMASIFGKFLTILGLKRREANILVVGLDNSGKSTILNYLKRKEDRVEEIVPTVGFTVERLSGLDRHKANLAVTAFDMSGQGRYRNLWEHYYANVEAIIFVVDSTDALRLVVARDELEMMLKHHKVSSNLTGGATATAAAAGKLQRGCLSLPSFLSSPFSLLREWRGKRRGERDGYTTDERRSTFVLCQQDGLEGRPAVGAD